MNHANNPAMSKELINLPRKLTNRLLHLAQISSELEVCGLIGSRHGIPTTCYPIENVAPSPAIRYELDPREQVEAMRRMRERGEALFAIYHSHPQSPPEPSATDLASANYPEALYLIISLNTKGVLEMRGFRMDKNEPAKEVDLILGSGIKEQGSGAEK
jgi:[CysO sulfur-carrier protein]-S-L-cysteine hydrolase